MYVSSGHPPQVPHTNLPYMVCTDSELGTDHCLKEAKACLIWHRVHVHRGLYGNCH